MALYGHFINSAVKDCTFVIHVASPFPMEDPKDEMEVIGPAVEGTLNVLEACAKTKGEVKRVVLTSSCAAIIGKNVVVLSLRKTSDICDATTCMVSPRNDVRETSAEIPY